MQNSVGALKKSFNVKNVLQSYDIKIDHGLNFSLRFKKDKFRDQGGQTCTQSEKKTWRQTAKS